MRTLVTTWLVVTAATAALATGCGSKSAPSCEEAAAHTTKLMRTNEQKNAPNPEQMKPLENMLVQLETAIVEQCKAAKWTDAVRTCIVAAKTVEEMDKCDTQKKP